MRGVVGSRGRNIAAALAKSPLAALKVLREAHTEEAATFLEQDSTTVPNFANRHYVYRENSLVNHGVTEKRCIVFSVLDWICKDASANFPEAETCFRQTALDTAARLAMQTVSADADKNTRNYLERFRDVVRCHFSWRALALCPDGKSAAAELALWGGIPIFKALAAIYRLIKHMKKKQSGVTGENGQSGSH